MNRRLLILGPAFVLLCGPCLPEAAAQDAFSRISVRTGGTLNVNESRLHENWSDGYGAELLASTPFYLGRIEMGAAVHQYDNLEADVPSFTAMLALLGWGGAFELAGPVSWFNGVLVGNYRMAFDEETFRGVRNESELVLGLQSRLDLGLTDAVGMYAAARFLRAYTAPRIDLVYVSGGLILTLPTPGWLRDFLR